MFNRRLERLCKRLLSSNPQIKSESEHIFMASNPRYSNYRIGEWTYGYPKLLFEDGGATLVIGRFCSIAEGVTILLGGEHRKDWVTTYPFSSLFPDAQEFLGHPGTKGDVVIGSDVWIGLNTLILSGVTIGNGAVIAARSVVAGDVAPYSIVAGNPAKQVKFRFSESTINSLLHIAWWDWPIEKIKEAWPLLLSDNIDAFVARHS